MPFYLFKCEGCHAEEVKKLPASDRNTPFRCSHCTGNLRRHIAVPSEAVIMETGSQYHGWKKRKGVESILKKRARQDLLDNIGEIVEKHGLKTVKKSTLLKDGKKRTVWDEK